VREALLGARLADTGYFNRPYLEHIVAQHDSGARNYSAPIWSLLMFEAFLRGALDASQPAPSLRVAV
jgi:asparagine synthase (glutamine-hydrolysing)